MIVGDAMDGDALPTSTVPDSSPGLAASPAAADLDPDVVLGPERAVKLGRYVLLERLGAGAMGVVFAAYDPELDRKVAIKLLRGGEYDREHAERRLLREARALARLAHPNVVAVHDAGTVRFEGVVPPGLGDWDELAFVTPEPTPSDGSAHATTTSELVFIAMEFVDGLTLRSWLAQATRSRDDVIAMFLQAGRGLAAAHAARIVHRDFKPDNVLVDREGRVRVMDFGLARAGEAEIEVQGSARPHGLPSRRESTITRAGAIAGTPVYMAPEQHLGGPVGPQSDQFAFCVALWESLYGERPFAGKTWPDVAEAVIGGKIREPPTDRGVPVRLRHVLERGLARDVVARWPDMAALLDALATDPRWRWRSVGTAGVGLGAIAAIAWFTHVPAIDCEDPSRLAGAWDDTTREAVASSLLATGVSFAEETRSRVEQDLDDYAARWMAEHVRACEPATALSTDELRTAQAVCIADHRRALAALVEVLSHADADAVRNAASAAAGLPDVARCSDVEYLSARVKPPDDPGTAAAVEAAREELSRATALQAAGSYPAALRVVDEVVASARELDYGPLLAEGLQRKGDVEKDLGTYQAAEPTLREAYGEAIAAGYDSVAADVAVRMISLLGYRLARYDDAKEWILHAQSLVRHIGLGGEHEAFLLDHLGTLYDQTGDYERSREHYARALEIRERVHGPDALLVAQSLLNNAYADEGTDPERARQLGERALAIEEARLGPNHPETGLALHMLGRLQFQQGHLAEAAALLRRALAVKIAGYGPDHASVATTNDMLAATLLSLGEYTEALDAATRSLAAREKLYAPDDPHVAMSLSYLARIEAALGRHDDAIAHARRVLAIFETKLGADHPNVADALAALGGYLLDSGELDEALRCQRRVLEMRRAKLDPNDPQIAFAVYSLGDVERARGDLDAALEHHLDALALIEQNASPSPLRLGRALHTLGQTRLARGEVDEAIVVLERAAALWTRGDEPPDQLAALRFVLAQALVQANRDPERARALAEQARDGYRERGATKTAEVEAWLAALPQH